MISQVAGDPHPAPTEDPPARRRTSHHITYVPALDGLRGIAVVGVILFHFGYLKGGYLGVDLFFVLSGFLITSILLVERGATGRIDLKSFWGRRARRLLPALLLLLGGVALFCVLWARKVDLGAIRGDGIGALFYVANWRAITSNTDYWAQAQSPSPLQHVWSLAIEEQFYLVWPLVVSLVLWASAGRARSLAKAAAVGAAISAVLLVVLHQTGAGITRLYEGTDTRAAALLIGAALAGLCDRTVDDEASGRTLPPFAALAASIAPAAVLVLGILWVVLPGTSDLLYQGLLPLTSLLCAVVIYAVVILPEQVKGLVWALNIRPLRAIGMLSYGLYLWHWPVSLVLSPVRTGWSGPLLLLARVTVTTALALASYYFVERPIRRGTFLDGWSGLVTAVAGMVLALCLVLLATNGAVSVADVNVINAKQRSERVLGGVPRVLYLGDSVAESISQYPIVDPASYQIDAYNAAGPGCALIFEGNRVRSDSGEITEPATCSKPWPGIINSFDPDVVLLLQGSSPTAKVEIDGHFEAPCSAPYEDLQKQRIEDQVAVLQARGAKAVLVTSPHSDNPFRPDNADEVTGCHNRTVRAAAKASGAALIDLDAHLCPDGKCATKANGELIRPDALHFNGKGGEPTARWLIEQALAAASGGS